MKICQKALKNKSTIFLVGGEEAAEGKLKKNLANIGNIKNRGSNFESSSRKLWAK